jgi:hypothetical protein
VVGCAGAWRELAPSDLVWVDGDLGLVARLAHR